MTKLEKRWARAVENAVELLCSLDLDLDELYGARLELLEVLRAIGKEDGVYWAK